MATSAYPPPPMSARALFAFFTDKRLRAGPLPFFVATTVAVNVAAAAWQRDLAAERQANMLLDTPATVHAMPDPGDGEPAHLPRFDWSVGEDLPAYWKYIPDARKQPLIILSGMSQMYAINETKPGDQTIAEWLDDAIRPEGSRVFGLAAPNLSNEEALVYLLATLGGPETRPDAFVYGLCFDKFRNIDLRVQLTTFLRTHPGLEDRWRSTCDGRQDRFPMACEKMRSTLEGLHAAQSTSEDDGTVEGSVRAAAGDALPMVAARKDLNALAQIQAFYLRNWVFDIQPTSKRPIIQSRYELNKQLLELMIDVGLEAGIQMAMYVIPLNPLAENPYVAEEYEAFKRWAEETTKKRGVHFDNLESVVPASEWGEFMGGPDFKHFKGEGHRATAEALKARFGPMLGDLGRLRSAR